MRGRRRSLASVLADALAANPAARPVALAAAFAEACGPRLAREASVRGVTREGHLLVVATSPAWAAQLRELAPDLVDRLNTRLGRTVATGMDVHVGADR
jgi:hypothetical protein